MKKIKKMLAISLVALCLTIAVGTSASACLYIGNGMWLDCGNSCYDRPL